MLVRGNESIHSIIEKERRDVHVDWSSLVLWVILVRVWRRHILHHKEGHGIRRLGKCDGNTPSQLISLMVRHGYDLRVKGRIIAIP